MAFLTGPAGEWCVHFLLEELRILRGVGIMAAHAIDSRGIDSDVGFGKRLRLEVMAVAAQGLQWLGE